MFSLKFERATSWLRDKRRVWMVANALLVTAWLFLIWGADENAYPIVYVLCAVASLACVSANQRKDLGQDISGGTAVALAILTVWFSGTVCLANYPIFEPVRSFTSLWKFILCAMGGGSIW